MSTEVRDNPQRAEDEQSLVRRVVAGDRGAFERLMRRYNQRLYRLARATLRDRTEAEDALQDAYVAAYRSMNQFRGDSAFSTWLTRLVLNECLARLRRDARRQNVVPLVTSTPATEAELDNVAAQDADLPDSVLNRMQVREMLERKLDGLPDSYRTVFVLRSVEDMTVEEVARILEISEATVRIRHFRARAMLRELLARDIDLATSELFEFQGVHCDKIVAGVLARLASRCGRE
jgi:RNA polymerase sigma factor (sigma-70 family)